MFYSEELVEEIREKNDIVDVIGSFVGLKRAGNSYMCCCPFHNEKTPSFHVSRTKQIYHCFGCGVGGNVITFLMQYENYTFAEALKYLADRAGIPLPENEMSPEQKKVENRRELLREVSKSAAAYYHYILTKTENGIKGRDYFMEKRGFTEETIANFGLGYADKYSDGLYKYLKSRGYSDDLMRDSGLVNFTEKYGAQDIFWNRVMVPITDIGGKVIAFGGRVLGDAKPKYLNTKETDIFNKRRNLFAMNIAKRSRRRGIILCEGYMDVISMHQAGFDNAVASLGTAFTEEQALIIKRYTSEVYLAYDSDGAGRQATLKAIEILRNADMTQRVIDMSPYKDPDEFIKALGAEEYEQRIKDAKPGLLFETELLAKEYKQNDPEERTEFIGRVARLLKPIEDPVRMNSYIEIISNKYQIEKEYLRGAVDTTVLVDSRDSSPVNDPGVRDISPDGAAVESQKLLLTWMVNEPELFKKLENVISVEDFTDDNINAVAKLLYEQYEKQGKVSPAAIIDRFESLESQQVVAAIMNTELPRMLDGNEKNKAFTEIVKRVKSNSIESALKNNKDPQKLMDLIQRKKSLDRLEVKI
ncbi:DNA primase [Eubacterium ruminantium]|uniref:DNA primase n=1 Tax=Eubacterium ruminantium TaxID=42322 RepID=A0A1T4K9S7_9FIRM|nr:DNA primase [Eubacterium ruminantium]SCW26699.1 DNA primase [Eubacterium ruminantium]SDM17253.1 DNA primase [Eubacterium ruminantium]SJZ39200.1 DNA primase [Eubacterium ruminantium]